MNVVVRNGLSLISSQVATILIALVMLLVVPRYLGDVDFGKFSFSLTYVGFFYFVGSFGTNSYLTKATARDPELVGPYLYNAIVLKLVMAVGLSAVAVGLGVVVGFDGETMLLVAAACLAMAFTLVNETLVAGLFGLQRMGRPAAWGVAQQYVAAALGIAAVIVHAPVVVYAFVIVPAALIPIIANFVNLRPDLRRASGIDVGLWRVVLAGGLPFLIMGGIQLFYGSIDMVMLRPLAGDATVGWYALAYRWISLPVLLASTAMLALFPSLSVHGIAPDERFSRLANRALMFVAFVGFPAATGIALVADEVIPRIYHGQFHETIILMQILAISIPIVVIDMVLGMVMMASDRQKQWMIIGGVAAVLNPAINLVAIPFTVHHFHNGAIGASVATVLTEIVMLGGALLHLPDGVMDRATKGFMLRCAAATAAMALVVLGLGDLPLVGEVAVGVLVYAVAALVFRIVTRAEFTWFRGQLGARSASRPSAAAPIPTSTHVE